MDDFRKIGTMALLVALGSAVVFNAGKVQPLMREVRIALVSTLETISGVNRGV